MGKTGVGGKLYVKTLFEGYRKNSPTAIWIRKGGRSWNAGQVSNIKTTFVNCRKKARQNQIKQGDWRPEKNRGGSRKDREESNRTEHRQQKGRARGIAIANHDTTKAKQKKKKEGTAKKGTEKKTLRELWALWAQNRRWAREVLAAMSFEGEQIKVRRGKICGWEKKG